MTGNLREKWEALYEAADRVKRIQPWNAICSDDPIIIRLPESDEIALCSIMGFEGTCYGVSVFLGQKGLESFSRIVHQDEEAAFSHYMRYDQDCLTLYWGDREEVPKEQKDNIKELGLKFRGRGNWPFVYSFKRRYLPCTPNEGELAILVEVLQNLFMVARGFAEGRIDSDGWDGSNALMRWYNPETELWNMGWIEWKLPKLDYPQLSLTDEVLLARLKRRPRIHADMLADLVYLNVPAERDEDGRESAMLVFFLVDATNSMIVCADMVPLDIDELTAVITGFVHYVEEHGRMRQIRARNPWVLSALRDTCKACKISLVKDILPEMDEIMEEFTEMMFFH